jgi:uncharacterized repeat protein (TIGR01451 family)
VIVCALGQVNSGATVPVVITVSPTQPGVVINEAEVASSIYDPDLANNHDDHQVTVTQSDLRIIKSSSPALAGQPFTYTLEIFNDGPSTAVGVIVTDTLPADVAYASNTGGCTYEEQSHSVICSDLPPILFPGSAMVDIVVIPSLDGLITNSAQVTGARYDPDLSNNTSSIDTAVQPAADLEVFVSGPTQAAKDVWFSVRVTVTNHGPSDAAGVTITNTIQIVHGADVLVVNYPGCVVVNAGMITCSLPTISSNGSVSFDVEINRKSAGSYTNTATVSGLDYDPVPANNMDFIQIEIS